MIKNCSTCAHSYLQFLSSESDRKCSLFQADCDYAIYDCGKNLSGYVARSQKSTQIIIKPAKKQNNIYYFAIGLFFGFIVAVIAGTRIIF